MTLRPIALTILLATASTAVAAPTAGELFKEGSVAFDKGDYTIAVEKWKAAYRMSRNPILLFNIGQALENDLRCVAALTMYRKFVALAPTSEKRPEAETYIQELSAKCNRKASQEAVEQNWLDDRFVKPEPNRPSNDPARTQKIAGLAVGSAGLLAIGIGFYFGHRASSLGDEVTTACRTGCDWAIYSSKDADGRRAQTNQYVFLGLGVAVAAAGGVIYWLATRKREPAPIAIAPDRDRAVISWRGAW